jgi:hypothetical protein
LQTQRVDLIGVHVGGRVIAQQGRILVGAVREAPDAVVRRRDPLLRLHQRDDAAVSGLDLFHQSLAPGLDQPRLFGRRDRKLAHLSLEVGEQGAVRPADRTAHP